MRNQDIVLVNLSFSQTLDALAMQELVAKLHEQIQDCAIDNVFILGDMSRGSPDDGEIKKIEITVVELRISCLKPWDNTVFSLKLGFVRLNAMQ